MGFIPPINLGQFQPAPATLSQWIYQIWQFLQENPIATEDEIRAYIQSELAGTDVLADAVNAYLNENPPAAPVQSVQNKTGAVTLSYNEIVTPGNAIPVYRVTSMPEQNVLQGQYNIGYRFVANTVNRELYVLKADGSTEIVGRGVFDGTTIDVDSSEGDTTITGALTDIDDRITTLESGSIYGVGDVISDNTVKLGYCQSNNTDSTKSQVIFNVYLPKPIADDVTHIVFNSGTSMVVRAGGSRVPSSQSATLGTTTKWEYVSAVINKDLGVIRITINIPATANAEQNAATLAGTVTFTLAGDN